MPTTLSPLRYPGGKTAISPLLMQIISLNKLEGGTYIEPYAGGAGAAIALLFSNTVQRVIINDYDKHIYSFWHSILMHTDKFIQKIESTQIDITEWEKQRSIIENSEYHDTLDIGFAAFYLNRCNRSGILMAGPVGGKNQTGKYTLDARYKRTPLINKINNIALQRDKIQIYNQDAIGFLEMVTDKIPDPKLIYLDPPYYTKGELLYLNSYTHEDHVNLAWKLNSLSSSTHWVLTYDDTPQIRELYKKQKTTNYALNYFAHTPKKAHELLITPFQTETPQQLS